MTTETNEITPVYIQDLTQAQKTKIELAKEEAANKAFTESDYYLHNYALGEYSVYNNSLREKYSQYDFNEINKSIESIKQSILNRNRNSSIHLIGQIQGILNAYNKIKSIIETPEQGDE